MAIQPLHVDPEVARVGAQAFQAFAGECRASMPPPVVSDMTLAERTQYQILRDLMEAFPRGRYRSAIFARRCVPDVVLVTTRIGLTAAADVFVGTGTLLLTHAEMGEWDCRWPYVPGRCSIECRWLIHEAGQEGPNGMLRSHAWKPLPDPPAGATNWLVGAEARGLGSIDCEASLWQWDGRNAARQEYGGGWTLDV